MTICCLAHGSKPTDQTRPVRAAALMRIARVERRKKLAGQTCGGGFLMMGDPRDFPFARSMNNASQDGNFSPAIEAALTEYQDEASPDKPNCAPKALWHATYSFRTILYHSGKQVGVDAAAHLDRIPDHDLRLFAQIELAAAIAGLPELPGTRQRLRPEQRARRIPAATPVPMRTPDGTEVRCPECKQPPTAEDRWCCKCGHRWNTFWTRGECPTCHYQWSVTQCLRCGEVSPHSDWYLNAIDS